MRLPQVWYGPPVDHFVVSGRRPMTPPAGGSTPRRHTANLAGPGRSLRRWKTRHGKWVRPRCVACGRHRGAGGMLIERAGPDPSATSATSGRPITSTTTPSVSTAPADGADPQACADGTCEVRVTAGVTVPLPEGFGVGPLTVTAVHATGVTVVTPLTMSQFAVDGTCSAGITGATVNAPPISI